jgi:hypothetical protein
MMLDTHSRRRFVTGNEPLGGDDMGVTYVEGTLAGPSGKKAAVDFPVDGGATYTLLPYTVWQDLGDAHTPVILGKPGDEALLGVVTLEILGLIFHPFKLTLEPMRMLLA